MPARFLPAGPGRALGRQRRPRWLQPPPGCSPMATAARARERRTPPSQLRGAEAAGSEGALVEPGRPLGRRGAFRGRRRGSWARVAGKSCMKLRRCGPGRGRGAAAPGPSEERSPVCAFRCAARELPEPRGGQVCATREPGLLTESQPVVTPATPERSGPLAWSCERFPSGRRRSPRATRLFCGPRGAGLHRASLPGQGGAGAALPSQSWPLLAPGGRAASPIRG